jgi:5'-nucleotidase
MSLTSFTFQEFQPAADFATKLLAQLSHVALPEVMLFNVNVPALPAADIAGVSLTRQGIRRYHDLFQKRVDPRGKTYYWLAGEVLEEVPETDSRVHNLLTDVEAIRKNLITITPLKYNLTHTDAIPMVQAWLENSPLPKSHC